MKYGITYSGMTIINPTKTNYVWTGKKKMKTYGIRFTTDTLNNCNSCGCKDRVPLKNKNEELVYIWCPQCESFWKLENVKESEGG